MGQKTNPIGNRLGIIRGWDSNWYGGNDYGDKIAEDYKIRKYIHARLTKASVSKIIIERTLKLVTVTITTARPGIIIGKGGQEVDKLKEELKKITDKEIQINIFEIKRPELDAYLVGNSIARQIESRISYRRAIKMAIAAAMRMNAEGIKVLISGRLNGAEMARSAGTYAQLLARDSKYATLKLPSGEMRMVLSRCLATVGSVSNSDHMNTVMGKAGRHRWLGRRPRVRGVVMNPVDHPMGGGEGRSSGGHPRSRNGLLAKGKKTRTPNKQSNRLIISRKKK